MDKIYIDEEIRIVKGVNAEKLLEKNNDLEFFDSNENGIHKVSSNRWEIAQKYEKKTWMNNKLINDDRNLEHFERFNYLTDLDNLSNKNKNIIELGCGPFTNIRLFNHVLNPKNITLLDPLINEYLNHPNCTYKNNELNQVKVELVNSPIESFSFENKFDIVVIINVIEHCFDVDLIFNKILSLLNDDGILIFSDVYFTNVKTIASCLYDAGHPIRLSEEKLDKFLYYFEPIYEKRFNGLYSQEWRNDLYFIGKKRKNEIL